MASESNKCWLLVEWKSGGFDVVHIKAVLSTFFKELKKDEMIVVNRFGVPEEAKLVARARERVRLDAIVRQSLRMASPTTAGPSVKREREQESEDFCSSSTSWAYSDDDDSLSADSDEIPERKFRFERCRRQYSCKRTNKNTMTPSHRSTPVIPMNIQQPTNMMNRLISRNIVIDKIEDTFNDLFKMIDEMKQIRLNAATGKERVPEIFIPKKLGQAPPVPKPYRTIQMRNQTEPATFRQTVEDYNDEEEIDSDHTELNRSSDNVLITNKFTNTAVKTVQNRVPEDNEWIPIGSGKTLIHRDKYRKVKWKSYTIATRTLLQAVFSRRVLATHSLTGKKSPAFQDKPAKMCLDPKITTDIIYEVMDRFNVKENLVRSIITTKCADETKMWKNLREKRNAKRSENKISSPLPPPLSPLSPIMYLDEENTA